MSQYFAVPYWKQVRQYQQGKDVEAGGNELQGKLDSVIVGCNIFLFLPIFGLCVLSCAHTLIKFIKTIQIA